ncbi:MAG: GNAT family N-acetyltransferase [Chitinophagaceae bacterium]|nr:GNAT family N-acetyltransferase [Rubrivivax sp.]
MIEIVPFQPALQKGVVDLIVPIQRDEFGFDVDVRDQPDLLDIGSFYQSGGGGFWVGLDDDRAVGTIGLRDIGNHQAALRKMFVAAHYRGREHALAARLLDRLLQHAQLHGVRQIFLGTTERFLAAHRFYEKQGFIRTSPDQLPEAFPRMAVDTRFYQRRLLAAAAPDGGSG